MFGDKPLWGVGRMGQIYMGRENPFGELVAVLTADEFLLLRKAVDERHSLDEVGVGKLAENAAAYRPDPEYQERGAHGAWYSGSIAAEVPRWHCRCCDRGLPHSRVPFSSIVASRSPR